MRVEPTPGPCGSFPSSPGQKPQGVWASGSVWWRAGSIAGLLGAIGGCLLIAALASPDVAERLAYCLVALPIVALCWCEMVRSGRLWWLWSAAWTWLVWGWPLLVLTKPRSLCLWTAILDSCYGSLPALSATAGLVVCQLWVSWRAQLLARGAPRGYRNGSKPGALARLLLASLSLAFLVVPDLLVGLCHLLYAELLAPLLGGM